MSDNLDEILGVKDKKEPAHSRTITVRATVECRGKKTGPAAEMKEVTAALLAASDRHHTLLQLEADDGLREVIKDGFYKGTFTKGDGPHLVSAYTMGGLHFRISGDQKAVEETIKMFQRIRPQGTEPEIFRAKPGKEVKKYEPPKKRPEPPKAPPGRPGSPF